MFIQTGIQVELRKLISTARTVDMAVAFWGEGAAESLGLSKKPNRKVRIICDLYSGACNPHELSKIKRLGCHIFHKARLHSKVYLTEKGAILGSSNASANGLGFEGNELLGNIEANYSVSSAGELRKIAKWFEDVALKGAVRVNRKMLRRADAAWRTRRRMRNQMTTQAQPRKSLWRELLTHPERFRDKRFFIAKYDDHYSDLTRKRVLERRRELKDRNIDAYEMPRRNRMKAGDIYLDVFVTRRGPRFVGIYKIAEEIDRIKRKSQEIVFCRELSTFDGLYCSRSDAKEIENYAQNGRFFAKSLGDIARELGAN